MGVVPFSKLFQMLEGSGDWPRAGGAGGTREERSKVAGFMAHRSQKSEERGQKTEDRADARTKSSERREFHASWS